MTPREREEMRRRKEINDRRRRREQVKRGRRSVRNLRAWERQRRTMAADEFRAAIGELFWPDTTDEEVGAVLYRCANSIYKYRTGRARVPDNIAKRLRRLLREQGAL